MRFVIVTGMSGAGKSTTLKMMEDMGYFCVDNMPIPLMSKLTELFMVPNGEINKVALGLDIRSGQNLDELENILNEMDQANIPYEVLFLEAGDETLVKRYKETRRNHPLAGDGRIEKGIALERQKVSFLKKRASYILDTSRLLTRELKAELNKIFLENKTFKNLYITVLSFGFKFGIPNDADLVFDVRFLPNPYYIDELRPLSGNDKPVQDYVMNNTLSNEFLNKLVDMVQFLVPNYAAEGKHQLVIAIGCTGGKHRSVTIANALFDALSVTEEDYGLKKEHRDIEKDSIVKAK
ncbi:MAG: RNase adapter RapZ [Bariatricus sp.]|nr:RNase adapter RapZ [Bariatricus sp.]